MEINQDQIRFEQQLNKVETLLQTSLRKKNQALWLLEQDLRTPCFMLEGLSRLHKGLGHKKPFTKWQSKFKNLEDTLGMMDFNQSFLLAQNGNKQIPVVLKQQWKHQLNQASDKLMEVLNDEDWLNGLRLNKIRGKLSANDRSTQLKEGLKPFIQKEIQDIIDFHKQCSYVDMELDVHELRRKLRWISIYAAALQGSIALKPSRTTLASQKKYLVKDILQSPYNVLPKHKDIPPVLFFDKNSFYALSFMISRIGKLKDQGLMITSLKQTLMDTQHIGEEEALLLATQWLKVKPDFITQCLKESANLTNVFVKEGHLNKLVV